MRKFGYVALVLGLLFVPARSYQVQYLLHANQVVIIEPYQTVDIDMPWFKIHIHKPFNHIYGHGSGVLIGHKGYILTAKHVVKNSSLFFIRFKDGRTFKAVYVAVDGQSDLGLLKIISSESFNGVSYLGPKPLVGDSVYHIGSPIDLEYILTTGVISAVDQRYLVSDTVVNPGSSGGALFNRQGLLIGICSALKTTAPYAAWSGHSLFVRIDDIRHFLGMWKEVL